MFRNRKPSVPEILLVAAAALWLQGQPVSADLIAHWTLNEGSGTTARDEAGHASGPHDGEVLNGPRWVAGVDGLGSALFYDGNDDRIVVPSFDVEGPGITIATWIRPETLGSDNRIVSKTIGSGTPDHWWALVYKNTGRIEFRLRTDVGGTNKGTGTQGDPLVIGEWSHIAATWSSVDETKRLAQHLHHL